MTRGSRIRGLLAVVASGIAVAGNAAPASAATTAHTRTASHRLPLSASRLTADERSHQAAAHQTTTITGLVRTATGKPLASVCVAAFGAAGHRSGITGANGRYAISGLRAGQYSIEYRACGAGGYLTRTTASKVLVGGRLIQPVGPVTLRTFAQQAEARMQARPATNPTALARRLLGMPKLTAGSNVATAGRGRIEGKLTDQAGKPIRGVCVVALSRRNFGEGITTKNGSYRTGKLPPGRYEVIFEACRSAGNWIIQVYKNSEDLRKHTTVSVAAGHTTAGIDAKLKPAGEISGVVTGQAGKKLSNICVEPVATSRKPVYGLAIPTLAERGSYHLRNLPPGKYRIEFIPCSGNSPYLTVWWRNSATRHAAKIVNVRAGHPVSAVDQAMPLGGKITGTVTNSADSPLSKICVFVESGQYPNGLTRTGSDGSYTLVGLPTGTYRIRAEPGCGNNGNYLGANSAKIAVTQGQTAAGVDIVLPTGAEVTGTVTNLSGQPVQGICVGVFGGKDGGYGNIVVTRANGTYRVDQLPAGSYSAEFFGGCGNQGSYVPQAWQDAYVESPTPIEVAAGQTVSGISAVMQPGATITGQVINSKHQRVPACVQAGSPELMQETAGDYSDYFTQSAHGSYRLSNLQPGEYDLTFAYCGRKGPHYAGQWFRAQPGSVGASAVWAGAGTITSGVDAVLMPGGALAGKVRTVAGHRVPYTCLQATDLANGDQSPFVLYLAFGNGVGSYRLGGLQPGPYRVVFQSGCGGANYATQWYRGSATERGATKVVVQAGHVTTGISSTLVKGGTISGRVTAAGTSTPLSNICVFAQDPSQYYFYGFGATNKQGYYRVVGLNTGRYEVTFSPCNNGGAHNAADLVLSHMVHVRTGQPTTGVDASLKAGGTITGTVSGGSPTAVLPAICLTATGVTVAASSSTTTRGDGSYQLKNLPQGKYRVSFYAQPDCDESGLYAPQSYRGTVSVTAGGTTSGVNVTLGNDGSISGRVTNTRGIKLTGVCVTAFGPTGPVVATTSSGLYTIGGLVPGRYRVQFSAGCGTSGLRTQWWQHAATRSKATVLRITPGLNWAMINATMHG